MFDTKYFGFNYVLLDQDKNLFVSIARKAWNFEIPMDNCIYPARTVWKLGVPLYNEWLQSSCENGMFSDFAPLVYPGTCFRISAPICDGAAIEAQGAQRTDHELEPETAGPPRTPPNIATSLVS